MASAPAWSRHLLLSIFRTWGASPTQLLGEPVLAPCRTQTSPAAQEANSSTSASGGGGGGGRIFLQTQAHKGTCFHGWCFVPLEVRDLGCKAEGLCPHYPEGWDLYCPGHPLRGSPLKWPVGMSPLLWEGLRRNGGSVSRQVRVGNSVMLAWGKSRSFGTEKITLLLCQAPV